RPREQRRRIDFPAEPEHVRGCRAWCVLASVFQDALDAANRPPVTAPGECLGRRPPLRFVAVDQSADQAPSLEPEHHAVAPTEAKTRSTSSASGPSYSTRLSAAVRARSRSGRSRRQRSEERRVGKECRCRWSSYHLKKKKNMMR